MYDVGYLPPQIFPTRSEKGRTRQVTENATTDEFNFKAINHFIKIYSRKMTEFTFNEKTLENLKGKVVIVTGTFNLRLLTYSRRFQRNWERNSRVFQFPRSKSCQRRCKSQSLIARRSNFSTMQCQGVVRNRQSLSGNSETSWKH